LPFSKTTSTIRTTELPKKSGSDSGSALVWKDDMEKGFTVKLLETLKPRTSMYRVRDTLPDPDLKGFAVKVSKGGSKQFFIAFTSPTTKKRCDFPLGSFPALSLTKARQNCRDARRLINQGIDPIEASKARKLEVEAKEQARTKRGTVEQLYAYHVEDLIKLERTSSTIKNVKSQYRCHVARHIGAMTANEVTAKDILRVLRSVEAPYQRKEVFIRLKAAFKFGMVGENTDRWSEDELPAFDIAANPADRVPAPILPKRKDIGRHLDKNEVAQLWRADDKVHKHVLYATRLLLLSGLRIQEVLEATWDEIDTEQRVWSIPAHRRKVEFDHVVPLTGAHLDVFSKLRHVRLSNKYIFPHDNGVETREFHSLGQALGRLRQRIGMDHFAPRDIRRTFKTLAGECGLSLEIRNRLQGHSMNGVASRHYDKYDYMPEKREAIERWAKYLDKIVRNAKGGENVVRIA
jgi:integrase